MTDHHNKYGPRTEIVERVIERAGRLTDDEKKALRVARGVRVVPVEAVWGAAEAVGRADACNAARVAVWSIFDGGAWDAEMDAASDAAFAAVAADLKGRYGLTRKDLEAVTGPWRSVINDVDPLEGIYDD